MHWLPFPFVRICFFFIAGILLGIYSPDEFVWPYAAIFLTLLIVLYGVIALQRRWNREIIAGILGLFIVLFAGYCHSVNYTASQNRHHLINIKKPVEFYTACLRGAPEDKDNFWKVEANIERVRIDGKWISVVGKVQLYFFKKDFPTSYRYGDMVLIQGMPQVVEPPGNPGEFDYSRFLRFKNIYHQQFLKKRAVKFVEHQHTNPLLSWSFAARQWANGVLTKYIHSEQERGIASALVLGVTNGLDNDLLNAYAATGTLHVLSVSGLHVSIIYLIIAAVLKPINKYKFGKWLVAFSSILILWSYAFITGLSPSVLRAVTMFSFVALSKLMNRRPNIYNTLALSAFCLLLYDPFMIMSLGFQLSYLAVFGIVYLQPSFYQWWAPDSKILDEVWKVTSVSLAAQLATFGLGLLYFNQFPNYFLLSNLLVIPGSFVVLISGLTLLAFDFIQPVAFYLGIFIEWTIRIMNYFVVTIETLPFSIVENVYINTFQYWLLTGALIASILFVKFKRYSYLFVASFLLILFSIIQWVHFQKSFSVQKIAFYKIPRHSAVDFLSQGHAYFMTDTILLKDLRTIKFHIAPNRLLNGITQIKSINDAGFSRDLKGCKLISWKGKTILQITNTNFLTPAFLYADYVLISNNAIRDLVIIKKYVTFKKLIIDSSNSFYFADNLVRQAKRQKVDVYSVWHSGALIVSIDKS